MTIEAHGASEMLVAKKPSMMKRIIIGTLLAAFAFAVVKIVEDNFADRTKSCTFNGGTPAPRGFFQRTPSCAWSSSLLKRQINLYGRPEYGIEIARRFCRIHKGRMVLAGPSAETVCTFRS